MNRFIEKHYQQIMTMSKKVCKGSPEWEDVGHFAIETFMQHERGQELVDSGRGMNFLSGIMWRSFNSSTSQYHTIYRQKGRMHSLTKREDNRQDNNTYDHEQDIATEAIQGVLEDMHADKEVLWYKAMLFEMWLKEPNCSELSRVTGIPRTSIAKAVDEARTYIRLQLKNNGINYE